MNVRVNSSTVSAGAHERPPYSQAVMIGTIIAALLLLALFISLSRTAPAARPVLSLRDPQALNPEVRQAQRYHAAAGTAAVSAATNPELGAVQRYVSDNQEAIAYRLQADNPELRVVERYRRANEGNEGFLSANPEIGVAQRWSAMKNER